MPCMILYTKMFHFFISSTGIQRSCPVMMRARDHPPAVRLWHCGVRNGGRGMGFRVFGGPGLGKTWAALGHIDMGCYVANEDPRIFFFLEKL